MKNPALLLLPNVLGEVKHHEPYLPASINKAVASIDGLIAESEKAGRRFLGRFETQKPAHLIPIGFLNEHTKEEDIEFLLEPIRKGERWGLISDAGLPCIADPGSALVRRARQSGIVVQAFSGPCSFILALMLSGLPGQNFTFHGYLDKDPIKRGKQIQDLEKTGSTHIFMERPYLNQQMLTQLLETLSPNTWLCAAWELTMPDQGVVSQPVSFWKKSPLPQLDKKNTVFLVHA